MITIIPTLLCQSADEMKKMARRWVDVVDLVQVDFADGQFVPNQLPGIEAMADLPGQYVFECHLMVQRPADWIDELLELERVKTVIIHIESDGDMAELGQQIIATGKKFGLALRPDTPLSTLAPLLPIVNQVTLLGVDPGFNGQLFHEAVVDRVSRLRSMWPQGMIEVDGGMTPETAALVAQAGVDMLTAGSYLSKGDPRIRLAALAQAVAQ